MTDLSKKKIITIDDVDYAINDLSNEAKLQINNIHFVDERLQQLNNEWAIADTAKIGYLNALKAELSDPETSA